MKNAEKSIAAVLLNLIQFNVFYQSLYIIDAEEYPMNLIIILIMLYTLVYREIIRKILKLNMKNFYICYFIGFVIYALLFIFSRDILSLFELIITIGLILFSNTITTLITLIFSYLFKQIFQKNKNVVKKNSKKEIKTKRKKREK